MKSSPNGAPFLSNFYLLRRVGWHSRTTWLFIFIIVRHDHSVVVAIFRISINASWVDDSRFLYGHFRSHSEVPCHAVRRWDLQFVLRNAFQSPSALSAIFLRVSGTSPKVNVAVNFTNDKLVVVVEIAVLFHLLDGRGAKHILTGIWVAVTITWLLWGRINRLPTTCIRDGE